MHVSRQLNYIDGRMSALLLWQVVRSKVANERLLRILFYLLDAQCVCYLLLLAVWVYAIGMYTMSSVFCATQLRKNRKR